MTQVSVAPSDEKQQATDWEAVNRVVFPVHDSEGRWPLYVDWGEVDPLLASVTQGFTEDAQQQAEKQPHAYKWDRTPGLGRAPETYTRHSIEVPAGDYLSLATYFNAFPASYWQRWTDAKVVRLDMNLSAEAEVTVMRSSGVFPFKPVARQTGSGDISFEIPLNKYANGGWLWFDVRTSDGPVTVKNATWSVPRGKNTGKTTKATVGITTFNMPDECIEQAWRFINNPDVLDRVAELLIVDQGNKNVEDHPGYPEVKEKLGDKLRIVRQDNLGGSGGFARGMYETLKNPDSDYVLLTDDDAAAEPEGVLRALHFADHTLKPTIVGGHMLNLQQPSELLAYAETVNMDGFWWHPNGMMQSAIDLSTRSLRNDLLLSRRRDAAYNGWWMCLIPKTAIEKLGLSMPYFIKWDDAEYGLRARAAGINTVSLPGAAVWHEPWGEKPDLLGWQAYYHQRNRWVTALIYSPHSGGGVLPRTSQEVDLKHLLSSQYYVEDLRVMGLEDVLKGPEHLHATLASRAQDARGMAKNYSDSTLITDPEKIPDVVYYGVANDRVPPNTRYKMIRGALSGLRHQLRPVRGGKDRLPEREYISIDATWFNLAGVDSALVTDPSGSGVWIYRRDREKFFATAKKLFGLYRRLDKQWDDLAQRYRAAQKQLTSVEAWEKTFGIK